MKDIDNVWTLVDEVSRTVECFIDNHMTKTNAEKLGLDSRAGYSLFVNDECIAVRSYNDRSLQYYGGFEYIDKEDRKELGEWVFYMSDSSRVSDCLDCFAEIEGV